MPALPVVDARGCAMNLSKVKGAEIFHEPELDNAEQLRFPSPPFPSARCTLDYQKEIPDDKSFLQHLADRSAERPVMQEVKRARRAARAIGDTPMISMSGDS